MSLEGVSKTIVIDRPLEDTWEYTVDGRNDPEWCKKAISVQQLGGDGPGPDATYRALHRPFRLHKPKELTVTVEEFNPPRRMRLREEDDDAVFYVTYELQSAGPGTRLTQRAEDSKLPASYRALDGGPRYRESVLDAQARHGACGVGDVAGERGAALSRLRRLQPARSRRLPRAHRP
jgi:Polyketide cyclase / dehydrase and lipid transport